MLEIHFFFIKNINNIVETNDGDFVFLENDMDNPVIV